MDFEDGGYPDWALTALFYAALHLADAVLVRWYPRPKDHEERNRLIARDSQLRHVRREYMELYQRSRDTRYECDSSIDTAFVQQRRRDQFAAFSAHARQLLSR